MQINKNSWHYKFWSNTYRLYRWRQDHRYQEPGLVGQWVRAKKERVCPLIVFTDEKG